MRALLAGAMVIAGGCAAPGPAPDVGASNTPAESVRDRAVVIAPETGTPTPANTVSALVPGSHTSPADRPSPRRDPAPVSLAEVTLGTSVRGTPIVARDHGAGAARVYLIGLIHGDEDEGFGALPAIERRLARLPAGVRVRLVPTMNPDGHEGGHRNNARNVDLNRNWPASNFRPSRSRGRAPASEPEVAAVLSDLDAYGPDVLIVFHSISRSRPFVNFDGPEPAARLAAVFADAARAAGGGDWTVVPDMGYPTPGSLGTYAGIDSGIATLTVEFKGGQAADEAERAAVAGVMAVCRAAAGGDTLGAEEAGP